MLPHIFAGWSPASVVADAYMPCSAIAIAVCAGFPGAAVVVEQEQTIQAQHFYESVAAVPARDGAACKQGAGGSREQSGQPSAG
jgi:hypothetical protein